MNENDNPKFIQFYHPGGFHGYDKIEEKQKTKYWNFREKHQRKLFHEKVKNVDILNNVVYSDSYFVCEWEPDTKVEEKDGFFVHSFKNVDYRKSKKLYEKEPHYKYMQNTDPFIFNDEIIYSNCRQPKIDVLKSLNINSLIVFGSKSNIDKYWHVDTVLVVKDMETFIPGKAFKKNKDLNTNKLFQEAVVKPLKQNCGCTHKHEGFMMYKGVKFDEKEQCNRMFSYFPVLREITKGKDPRPIIKEQGCLDGLFNEKLPMNVKGTKELNLSSKDIKAIWNEIRLQIFNEKLQNQKFFLGLKIHI